MFLQEKVKNINKEFEILKNSFYIVVWGAGTHTCQLFEKTNILSYHVKDIVDIDERKQGKQYFGFTIKKPETINWDNVSAVVISAPGKEESIIELLRQQINYKGNIIRLYEKGESTPFYLLYDEFFSQVRYLGDYDSWDNAERECNGYSDSTIIDKVIYSTQSVLNGSAAWERDGCLFYEKKYAYKICAAILRCAIQNNNKGVRILDIGGALGSTYFQNREYCLDVNNLEYIVAEQKPFFNYGHKYMENEILHFINSEEDYRKNGKLDIVLMSGSLQYIFPYKNVISKIISAEPRYIILDRILISNRARICKETVPEEIYQSSYPVRIFTEDEVIDFFRPQYKLVEKDFSSVPEEAYFIDGKAESRFFVFKIEA